MYVPHDDNLVVYTHHFQGILHCLHRHWVFLLKVVPSLTDGLALSHVINMLKSATWLSSRFTNNVFDFFIILREKKTIHRQIPLPPKMKNGFYFW